MLQLVIDGVQVKYPDSSFSEKELRGYIEEITSSEEDPLVELTVSYTEEDGSVALDYVLQPTKFERIRRITGYLVGTIDRWNNAKRSEERDRVKHGIEFATTRM